MTNEAVEKKAAEEGNGMKVEKSPLFYEFPPGGEVLQIVERMIRIAVWENRLIVTEFNGYKFTVNRHDDPYLITKQFYQELLSPSEYEEWEKLLGEVKNPE